MKNTEYSPYKIIHHPYKLHAMRQGRQPMPLQVQLVLTNACNHRCTFCAYRMDGYLSNATFSAGHRIKEEQAMSIIESSRANGIPAIQFTGGGEPLVHPSAPLIINNTIEMGMDVGLVTNGALLTEELCDSLGSSKWVRISVDAGTPETYRQVRGPDNYNQVLRNTEQLVKYRRNNIIGMGYVICHENYKEVFDMCRIAKDMGVDNFRISAAFTPQGYDYFSDFREEAQELAEECEGLSDENFKVFNMFNDRLQDCFTGIQDYDYCGIKELNPYVGADGNVYTCCTLAYNKAGLIGNLADHNWNMAEFWQSDEKRKVFADHKPCTHCKHPCMYEKKNQFINYCIDTEPKHVNFV